MQGEIKHSSLDFDIFYYNNFRQFCNAVCKGDVAKRETILRELHPKLLDNLTTQGLTSLGKAETPPRSPTPKPAEQKDKAETEAIRLANAQILTDVTAVASCILERNYRQAVMLFSIDFNSIELGGGVDSLLIGIIRLQQAVKLSREKGLKGKHYPKDYNIENNLCLL
ncbi:hypothetical protein K504DRAFT_449396 [Pleomassaria siparia CBS 279.74]|uniref:Uncharacterized protein n=1 Tax=Pleomassaria siparia CBS 279.74 TaxID=1314801 RepID=A0A6G1JVS2_9PLEO|nr:hypothetical protein K504DRAFT_449396 [Pleomassaria siparia CBS 279.74]